MPKGDSRVGFFQRKMYVGASTFSTCAFGHILALLCGNLHFCLPPVQPRVAPKMLPPLFSEGSRVPQMRSKPYFAPSHLLLAFMSHGWVQGRGQGREQKKGLRSRIGARKEARIGIGLTQALLLRSKHLCTFWLFFGLFCTCIFNMPIARHLDVFVCLWDIAQTFMVHSPNDALQSQRLSGQHSPRVGVGGQKSLKNPENPEKLSPEEGGGGVLR